MDGHSGVSNEKVNEASHGNFSFVLTFLKDASGGGDFVMHATSNQLYGRRIHPLDFLQRIGLTHFRGNRPFHSDRCIYGSIARKEASRGVPDIWATQQVHDGFSRFCSEISSLYELVQKEMEILGNIGFESGIPPVFGRPGVIEPSDTEIPEWVESMKFGKLQEAEAELQAARAKVQELSQFLPLLYGSGDDLEDAVLAALRFLAWRRKRRSGVSLLTSSRGRLMEQRTSGSRLRALVERSRRTATN